MTRFATLASLAFAAVVLGTTHRAVAQIETVYPAPPGKESKSIETAYPANYQPRVNNFPKVEVGPPLPAGGIRPAIAASSLGVGPTPATVAPGALITPGVTTAPGTATPVIPTDMGLPPDLGTIPPDTTTGTAATTTPSAIVSPTIFGTQYGTVPSGSSPQLINDPFGGSGPAYYLPPTSAPVYLPQSRNTTTVPSTNVWNNSAAMPAVVNPALYSNGVIVRQARSPNPYDGPRYIVSPARR